MTDSKADREDDNSVAEGEEAIVTVKFWEMRAN